LTALRLLFIILVLCSFLLGGVSAQQDFYTLLGVAQDADTSAIKKAFRRKSLEYHPDKNPGKFTKKKVCLI
jgi:preprotein translocase subunit Sec63